MKLETRAVEKPWGRTRLPSPFHDLAGRIGEIWFDRPDGSSLPFLAKYIFTSENLSVQVHPDEAYARARGRRHGKSEAWYILDAEPGARLGLGLKREVGAEEFRAAAIDGSIEAMIDWRPVSRGDCYYVPAGTVHSIGAGIALLEFQQNEDITYRLYDYGRPRELHLDDGLAVSVRGPYRRRRTGPPDTILVNGPEFSLVRLTGGEAPPETMRGRPIWVLPLEGEVRAGDFRAMAGECLYLQPDIRLELASGVAAVVGAAGPLGP